MFGCCSRASASASARKRAISSGPTSTVSLIILSATTRFQAELARR